MNALGRHKDRRAIGAETEGDALGLELGGDGAGVFGAEAGIENLIIGLEDIEADGQHRKDAAAAEDHQSDAPGTAHALVNGPQLLPELTKKSHALHLTWPLSLPGCGHSLLASWGLDLHPHNFLIRLAEPIANLQNEVKAQVRLG